VIDIYYPEQLIDILDRSRVSFIPKRLPKDQNNIKQFRRYYCKDFMSESYFKVIETYMVENELYGILKFIDDLYWTIPIENINTENIYEIIYDKNCILNQNIINSGRSYKGYEIRYWFFKNYNHKYSGFTPYIEDDGKCCLAEHISYFISADLINNKYTNIKIQIDKRRRQ